MSNWRFQSFVDRACDWCVNSEEDCNDFKAKHPKCPFICEFEDAEILCKRLDETEAYFQRLAEITPEDEYDIDAEEKAIGKLEDELEELKECIISSSKINLVEYHSTFGYEL